MKKEKHQDPRGVLHLAHKIITLFLCLCLLPLNGAYAAPARRSEGREESPMSTVSIPKELGTIEEFHQGTNSKTIVYIQDAHDSLEAQENIAKIIHYLVENNGVKTVFEEGYEGKVPTDEFFSIFKDPRAKEKVSYFLMDKLRLGGAEYAHVNRSKNFELIGVDSSKLLRENIDGYKKSAEQRELVEKDLEAIHREITVLANKHFPEELKTWMKLKERLDKDKIDLLDYLKRMTQGDIKAYPGIDLLIRAESSKNEKMIEAVKSIDAKALFEEIDQFENDYADSYLANPRDRKIYRIHKALNLLKRLNRLEVTPEEFDFSQKALVVLNTKKIAEFLFEVTGRPIILSNLWEQPIQKAIQFYKTAEARDGLLGKGLNANRNNEDEEIAALIFGGFHKNRIKAILNKKNYSYLIITPRISEISPVHRDYYKHLMGGGHHPFETPLFAAKAVPPERILIMMQNRFHLLPDLIAGTDLVDDPDIADALVAARSEARSEMRLFQDVRKAAEESPDATAVVDLFRRIQADLPNLKSDAEVDSGDQPIYNRFIQDRREYGGDLSEDSENYTSDLAIVPLLLNFFDEALVYEALLEADTDSQVLSYGVRAKNFPQGFHEAKEKLKPTREPDEEFLFYRLKPRLSKRDATADYYEQRLEPQWQEGVLTNPYRKKGDKRTEDMAVRVHRTHYIVRHRDNQVTALVSSAITEHHFGFDDHSYKDYPSSDDSVTEDIRSRSLRPIQDAEEDSAKMLEYIKTMRRFRHQRSIYLWSQPRTHRIHAERIAKYNAKYAVYDGLIQAYKANHGGTAPAYGVFKMPSVPEDSFETIDDATVRVTDEIENQANRWLHQKSAAYAISVEGERKQKKLPQLFKFVDEDTAEVLRFILGWGYMEREMVKSSGDDAKDRSVEQIEQIDKYPLMVSQEGRFFLGKAIRQRTEDTPNTHWKERLAYILSGGVNNFANIVVIRGREREQADELFKFYEETWDRQHITGGFQINWGQYPPYLSELSWNYQEDHNQEPDASKLILDSKVLRSKLFAMDSLLMFHDVKYTNYARMKIKLPDGRYQYQQMKIDVDASLTARHVDPAEYTRVYLAKLWRYHYAYDPGMFNLSDYDLIALRAEIERIKDLRNQLDHLTQEAGIPDRWETAAGHGFSSNDIRSRRTMELPGMGASSKDAKMQGVVETLTKIINGFEERIAFTLSYLTNTDPQELGIPTLEEASELLEQRRGQYHPSDYAVLRAQLDKALVRKPFFEEKRAHMFDAARELEERTRAVADDLGWEMADDSVSDRVHVIAEGLHFKVAKVSKAENWEIEVRDREGKRLVKLAWGIPEFASGDRKGKFTFSFSDDRQEEKTTHEIPEPLPEGNEDASVMELAVHLTTDDNGMPVLYLHLPGTAAAALLLAGFEDIASFKIVNEIQFQEIVKRKPQKRVKSLAERARAPMYEVVKKFDLSGAAQGEGWTLEKKRSRPHDDPLRHEVHLNQRSVDFMIARQYPAEDWVIEVNPKEASPVSLNWNGEERYFKFDGKTTERIPDLPSGTWRLGQMELALHVAMEGNSPVLYVNFPQSGIDALRTAGFEDYDHLKIVDDAAFAEIVQRSEVRISLNAKVFQRNIRETVENLNGEYSIPIDLETWTYGLQGLQQKEIEALLKAAAEDGKIELVVNDTRSIQTDVKLETQYQRLLTLPNVRFVTGGNLFNPKGRKVISINKEGLPSVWATRLKEEWQKKEFFHPIVFDAIEERPGKAVAAILLLDSGQEAILRQRALFDQFVDTNRTNIITQLIMTYEYVGQSA